MTPRRQISPGRARAGLGLLLLPTAMVAIDILFLALPAITVDLRASALDQLWIADMRPRPRASTRASVLLLLGAMTSLLLVRTMLPSVDAPGRRRSEGTRPLILIAIAERWSSLRPALHGQEARHRFR
jgi:hypothetical protein